MNLVETFTSAVELHRRGRLREAEKAYRQILAIDPGHVLARYNLGLVLQQQGRGPEAIEQYQAVLNIDPEHVGALTNLGAYYKESGDYAQALTYYDRVLRRSPGTAEAHYGRALARLALGDLRGGFEDYEWRLRLPDFPIRRFDKPLWDGSILHGQSLLLHAEQGFGDTFQFIRYLPWVRTLCDQVILQVQTVLVPILRHSGFENVIGRDQDPPRFDFQLPLLSLPRVARTDVGGVPAPIPYLSADAAKLEFWRQWLAARPGLHVGIAWKGSSKHLGDRDRSIPLARFCPLAQLPNVRLISLQKEEGLEELSAVDFQVERLPDPWDEADGAFLDTAAAIDNLDLVVSVDTAVAHLAGAMGRRVWVPLSTRPDWRWMLERQTTPWYPTMRLFRQSRAGDWSGPMAEIARELSQLAAAGGP